MRDEFLVHVSWARCRSGIFSDSRCSLPERKATVIVLPRDHSLVYPPKRQLVPRRKNNMFPPFLGVWCAIDSIPFEEAMSRSESRFDSTNQRISYAELQNLSDERLIEEIKAGNTDGFAVVFKRYHRLLHVTALKILRDAGEAEDLTQTVFLEVYRRLGQYDAARGTLKVWLLQFAYSRSMHRRNYLLVRQFHNQTELTGDESELSVWSQSRLHPHEAARLTQELLALLPESQRKTIELCFFEGLTLREIAERRAETYVNVRHHYYRGLERLRSYLKNYDSGEATERSLVPSGEA